MIPFSIALWVSDNHPFLTIFPADATVHFFSDSKETAILESYLTDSFSVFILEKKLFSEHTRSALKDIASTVSAATILINETGLTIECNHFQAKSTWKTYSISYLENQLKKLQTMFFSLEVKKRVITLTAPMLSELSQCLLQINAENQSETLQDYLKELDSLYLKIKPVFDAFHVLEDEYVNILGQPFPLLHKIRFFIGRYQIMRKNKVVFKLNTNLSYTDLVMSNYIGLTTLIELGFCFSLWHMDYGLVEIHIDMDSDTSIQVTFSDTGNADFSQGIYHENMAKSFEMLIWAIVKKLGGNVNLFIDSDAGFELSFSVPAQLFEQKTDNKTERLITEEVFESTLDNDFEQEILREFVALKQEFRQVLSEPYSSEQILNWRRAIHKIWPSAQQFGNQELVKALENLQQELKNKARADRIESLRSAVLTELEIQ